MGSTGISDHIVVISDGFLKNLLDKGVPRDKMTCHPQLGGHGFPVALSQGQPHLQKIRPERQVRRDVFGTISISSNRALGNVLEAAAALRDNKDVIFVIVGEGLKKAELRKRPSSLGRITFYSSLSNRTKTCPGSSASSDILLVPLDKEKSADVGSLEALQFHGCGTAGPGRWRRRIPRSLPDPEDRGDVVLPMISRG